MKLLNHEYHNKFELYEDCKEPMLMYKFTKRILPSGTLDGHLINRRNLIRKYSNEHIFHSNNANEPYMLNIYLPQNYY